MKAIRTVTLSMVAMALLVATASRSEGAVARASVTAEVIDPAKIDFKEVTSRAAEENATSSARNKRTEPEPQVKKTVVDGVTFITIDYN